jgi:serine/threonine protein kinase
VSITGELVMPAEVEIFPVRELAPDVRANIDADDEDYAITRRRSRAPSRIVNRDSADLLGLFRTPARIVDAVLSFAGSRGLDAEAILEHAYPLLHYLYESKVLIPSQEGVTSPQVRGLKAGASVEGFYLLRPVQVLEDNEVFLGRNACGEFAAIKYYPEAGDKTRRAIYREADMMRRAGSERLPRVYYAGPVGEGIALATEWIFGVDAINAAAALRQRGSLNRSSLLTLCVDIAKALAEVHESGILHGDIHPKNVLVEGRGSVRLIDFGLSRAVEESSDAGPRGGVPFYFDPQFAAAQRDHRAVALTPAAEQYSVASLLYQLWTGVFYIDWSLERDGLLRQIIEVDPASFESRGVPAWPALESIFRRALEKQPGDRFPSMRALAQVLSQLLPEAEARDKAAVLLHKEHAREKSLLDQALNRYAVDGAALRNGLADSPLSSVNYGAGGIAYFIYSLARRRGDPGLLALADIWIQRAFKWSSLQEAFFRTDLEIDKERVGEVSLFHSSSGLYCVRALISYAMGDLSGANSAMTSFLAKSRGVCTSPDLTLGKASLLIGCTELIEAMPVPWGVDLEAVRERGDELATELAAFVASDRVATSRALTTLGIAHGWAGIIFAVMRWTRASEKKVTATVVQALDELVTLAEPHGAGIRWPVHNGTVHAATYMDGWCNGAAGHSMLFALAHEVLGVGVYADLAERAAMGAWASDMRLGTLCCGLGGIGYASLAAYRVTGSKLWCERAHVAARRAAADSSRSFLRDSLYKGAVGVARLAEDLKNPGSASMPFFEPTT